jgi:hypothetical protein
VKPGVSTDILVKTASNEINNLTKNDTIILLGGSNDGNNSKAGLRNISHFLKNNTDTNIVLMGVLYRFGLPDILCEQRRLLFSQ